MKTIYIYIFSTVLLYFSSCSNKTSEHLYIGDIECTNIHVDVFKENMVLPEHIKSSHIVKLETNENCLIGKIKKMKVTDDRIFILDSSVAESLFVFDKEGSFLLTITTVRLNSNRTYFIA